MLYHISYIIYHIISYIIYHTVSYIIYHIMLYHISYIISYCIIYHISYITYHISYIIYQISYNTYHIIYHISYIIYHTSYIIYHISCHISCHKSHHISYHIIPYHIIPSMAWASRLDWQPTPPLHSLLWSVHVYTQCNAWLESSSIRTARVFSTGLQPTGIQHAAICQHFERVWCIPVADLPNIPVHAYQSLSIWINHGGPRNSTLRMHEMQRSVLLGEEDQRLSPRLCDYFVFWRSSTKIVLWHLGCTCRVNIFVIEVVF